MESAYDQLFEQFCTTHPRATQQIDGACWEYIACGRGAATLLLLPGGFGVAETSFRYMLAFEPTYRVIAVTYPATISSVAGLADGLAALLQREGVARAHVLGGSYSGAVAQCFARRHPALVHTLILSHTGGPRPARAAWSTAASALFGALPLPLLRGMLHCLNVGFLPDHSAAQRFWHSHFAQQIDTTPRSAYLNRLRVLRDFDQHHRFTPYDLRQHAMPILLIEAERDGLVGRRERAALQQLYPQARRHFFPRGSHADSVTRPEQEIAVIARWLACAAA